MYKISVVMPAYNVEAYIKRSIQSVIKQTLSDIELIVVDDGSTDHTPEILEEYSNIDNIRIVHQSNQGPSKARNVGLKLAMGEFVYFIDSDDYIEPDMFETMYNIAINENVDIVLCKWDLDKENSECDDYLPSNRIIESNEIRKILIGEDNHSLLWFCVKCIYRRKLLTDHNITFIEKDIVEDPPFNFEAFLCAEKLWFCNKVFYHYVQSPNSLTRAPYKKNYQVKLNNLYEAKLSISKKYKLSEYESNLYRYTMTHSIILLVSNELSNKTSIKEKMRNYKAIREAKLVEDAFKYSSVSLINTRIKYLVYLLKYRMYFLLAIIKR